MSRTGVEPKPPWRTVPPSVRHAVEETLGTEVRRAMRVWGGYGPTPTYRLRLADGRRAFFKAVSPDSNDFTRAAYTREEQVYRELGDLIAAWAPTFYGAFPCDGWSVILLEDLGPKSAPPWTPALTQRVARAYGDFHQSTLGMALPDWLPRSRLHLLAGRTWAGGAESDSLRAVAELASDASPVARQWLASAAPALTQASQRLLDQAVPHAFLHGDTRSDNLRWVEDSLRLFDWPHRVVGPPEVDVAAFAQSVTAEGGPAPEQVIAWYAQRAPVHSDTLDAAVAGWAAFFVEQAWQPDIPGLPRLRPFQRRQLQVTLAWAARRLRLPEPSWLNSIFGGEATRI